VTGNRISADLPQHWLHSPSYRKLSDRAWRLHTHALMWAIGQTDGHIPEDALDLFIGNTWTWEQRREAVKELIGAGKWKRVTGGWDICDWEATQTSLAQIEGLRRKWRDDKARQRKAATALTSADTRTVHGGHPVDSPVDDIRQGKARAPSTNSNQIQDANSRTRDDGRPPCAVPGCDQPARRSCRTCADHMTREPEFGVPS